MFAPNLSSTVLSVSELNRQARLAIERGLPVTWVAGEISNMTRATSGHWYFTLKDAGAAVRCAMFRNRNQFIDWRPENGMQVEVRGQASLYEPRGEFQLTVDAMRQAGLGALYAAFAQLKDKLDREGLFAAERKRPVPAFPRRIALVTSPKAAALRDVLTTLQRRWPAAYVTLYPTPVQGTDAARQIAEALGRATRDDHDVLLLVRGGGSIEDLWSFNEEIVARAIVASPVPVIAGVGHETDFTIADFAADLRAPTPTGAAQMATPDRHELSQHLRQVLHRLNLDMQRRQQGYAQRLDSLARRLQHPAARLQAQRQSLQQQQRRMQLAISAQHKARSQHLRHLSARLAMQRPQAQEKMVRIIEMQRRLGLALRHDLKRRNDALLGLSANLKHLDPEAVLGRGYSIVRNAKGEIVADTTALVEGDALQLRFHRGAAEARVTRLDNPSS